MHENGTVFLWFYKYLAIIEFMMSFPVKVSKRKKLIIKFKFGKMSQLVSVYVNQVFRKSHFCDVILGEMETYDISSME